MNQNIFLVGIGVFLFSTNVYAAENISCEKAVNLAEKFVVEQGYTDAPTTLTDDQIVHESLEWAGNSEGILALRKGTLNPKALGVFKEGEQWTVAFSFAKKPADARTGRGLRMGTDGARPKMVHEDLIIEGLQYAC